MKNKLIFSPLLLITAAFFYGQAPRPGNIIGPGPAGAAGATGAAGAGYTATSTTSFLIGTGSKAFTTQSGLAYSAGALVRISSVATPANYMQGLVTAYSGTTLTVNVTETSGSGTLASWNINLAGAPGDNTGTSYLWNGVPLTGVSFNTTAITNIASGATTTLYSNAADSGKRVMVGVSISNYSGFSSSFALKRVNSISCILVNTLSVANNSAGQSATAVTVLEPGESLSASVTVAGSLNFITQAMAYDSTNPLWAPAQYGWAISGDNIIYTVPAGKTALFFGRTPSGGGPFTGATPTFIMTSDSVNNPIVLSWYLNGSSTGTKWVNQGSTGLNVVANFVMPWQMSAGSTWVTNTDNTATTGCVILPIVWERAN